jgi:hypothetical protein
MQLPDTRNFNADVAGCLAPSRIISDWITENIRGSVTKSFSVYRQNEVLEAAT